MTLCASNTRYDEASVMILSLVDVCSVCWYSVPFSSDKMAPEAQTNRPEEGM